MKNLFFMLKILIISFVLSSVAQALNHEVLLRALSQEGSCIQFNAESRSLTVYNKPHMSAKELLQTSQGREDILLTAGSAFAGTFMITSMVQHPRNHTVSEVIFKGLASLALYGIAANSLLKFIPPHTPHMIEPGIWGILRDDVFIINHIHLSLPWKNIKRIMFNEETTQIEMLLGTGDTLLLDTEKLPVDGAFFVSNIIAAYVPAEIVDFATE